MENNEMFFVDVIGILPNKIDCFISSYDIEDEIAIALMSDINEGDFDKYININESNKNIFINRLKKATVVEYFQSIEIKKDSILLFRGYDGIESGTFSKIVNIPDWFKEKYKEGWTYSVSTDW